MSYLTELTDEQRQMCLASFVAAKKLHSNCPVVRIAADNGIRLMLELRDMAKIHDRMAHQMEKQNEKIVRLKATLSGIREGVQADSR